MNGNRAGVLAILMWSVANLLITSTGAVPAFLLGALVMIPGGFLLLLWDIGRGTKIEDIYRQSIFTYVVTFGGIGGYILLHYVAFKIASPFEVNVLDYTWPLFLVLFSTLIYKETLDVGHLMGLALGFAGMVLLFYHGMSGFRAQEWLGYSFSLTGALLFGLYSALTRKARIPGGFIGLILMMTGLLAVELHGMFEETIWPEHLIIWFAIAGLAVIRIAYGLWDYAMSHGDAVMLASLSYLLPLFSTFWFIVFGRMPLSLLTSVGGMFIITGCLAVNYPKFRRVLSERKNGKAL